MVWSHVGPRGWAADDAKVVQDPLHLLESLEKRRVQLDEQAKKLDIREQDLKRLEEKLATRIEALEKLRDVIKSDLEREKQSDDGNITRLGKIYASMKPGIAAEGLKALDQETAVKVLKAMPEKVVAKILNKMDVVSAGKLADELGMPIADKRRRGESP
ncbi:MAG: hypothetical protein HQL73_07970 [Magnetococcales bacterium]|nr:hypothetical protein [Magnetococcales bacterium]